MIVVAEIGFGFKMIQDQGQVIEQLIFYWGCD